MNHGGDLLSYKEYYKGELIDFSSNINPLGIPLELKEFIMDDFRKIEFYPDIQYRKLKTSIAKYLGSNEKNILVGNGAVEIIDIFTSLAGRVVLMIPSFSEYEERALVHGKEVVRIRYKDDFTIDLYDIESQVQENDLLVLGNPNNPTGLRLDKEKLIDIYDKVRSKGAKLLLDEAFFEFAPQDYDSIKLFKEEDYKNLGIIRAATKFFAIPGLRLGYGVTSLDIRKEVERKQMPWTVNAFADLAGQVIFDDEKYIEDSKAYIEVERSYLLTELSKIEDILVYNTHTNYILIKLLKYDEEYVFKQLLRQGIVVRKCASFQTLGRNHIRVAIKNRVNNDMLIRALKTI